MRNSKFKFALVMTMSVIFGSTEGYSSEELTETIKQSNTTARNSNQSTQSWNLSNAFSIPGIDGLKRLITWFMPNSISPEDCSNQFVRPGNLPDDLQKMLVSHVDEFRDLQSLASTCKYWDYLLTKALKNKIFIMGNIGSGKSTLINFLFGNPLTIVEPCNLIAEKTMPNIEIGNGYKSTTLKPIAVVDTFNERVFFDCPGFNDTREEKKNWVNAQAVHKLLKGGNIRVVLVVLESDFQLIHGQIFNKFSIK